MPLQPFQSLGHKNIIDSLLCNYGRFETTKHYLVECNRFNEFRQIMMQEISPLCEPTLDTLLYGKRALSDESKKHIFISIQEYLIKTKLFKQNAF